MEAIAQGVICYSWRESQAESKVVWPTRRDERFVNKNRNYSITQPRNGIRIPARSLACVKQLPERSYQYANLRILGRKFSGPKRLLRGPTKCELVPSTSPVPNKTRLSYR